VLHVRKFSLTWIKNEILLHARATRTVEVLLPFVKQQNGIAAPFVALPDFYIFFNGVPATPVVISFASVSAEASAQRGQSSRKQSKTTSTTVIALGGSHEVASILSDAYSPSFKTAFKEWLVSIPQYPKPFHFQVSSITDLLNFKMRDLFPNDKVDWGCEGHAASLETQTDPDGKTVTFFESVNKNGERVKNYCSFDSRNGLEEAIKRRRVSLKRAIEIYMEEVCIIIISGPVVFKNNLVKETLIHQKRITLARK